MPGRFSNRRLRRHYLFGHLWRPDWQLREIAAIGAPIFFQVLAEAGLFGAAAFLMGRIGEAELAAHTVALQIAAFTFQIPMGIGQAATIRVGYHYGAGDRAAMGRAGWASLQIGLCIALFSSSLMVLAPRLLLSAYIDVDAPERAVMVALALRYLVVAAAFQLVDRRRLFWRARCAASGYQGADGDCPAGLLDARLWRVGGAGSGHGLRGFGVWIGLATGLAVVAAMLLWRWNRREALGLVLPRP
jgi:MATE family multidrug resistance protein